MAESGEVRGGRKLRPETLMMSLGYQPELSEGSLKVPIFQTSTFVFRTAEEGKAFFEVAYGKRDPLPNERLGLIYSRLNNPDLEILEDRLAVWDGAEDAAVFESGLAAITTVLFEFLRPGDIVLHSAPIYGGTHHFIESVLPEYGIDSMCFYPGESSEQVLERVRGEGQEGRIGLIYVETPANPTNDLIDLADAKRMADLLTTPERKVWTVVDNTYLGPMWQKPLDVGFDLCVYSATKFIAGHSDLIAGSCSGNLDAMKRVKALRTFLGNMASPWTGWLLMRSLETLQVRMTRQVENAKTLARFLDAHPKVTKVHYPGLLQESDAQFEIYQRQCLSPGSMISFEVVGGEAESFRVLNALKVIHLAVSLGGTESLAEHPATMTHCDMSETDLVRTKITPNLIRLSVGIEDVDDLIWDLDQALSSLD